MTPIFSWSPPADGRGPFASTLSQAELVRRIDREWASGRLLDALEAAPGFNRGDPGKSAGGWKGPVSRSVPTGDSRAAFAPEATADGRTFPIEGFTTGTPDKSRMTRSHLLAVLAAACVEPALRSRPCFAEVDGQPPSGTLEDIPWIASVFVRFDAAGAPAVPVVEPPREPDLRQVVDGLSAHVQGLQTRVRTLQATVAAVGGALVLVLGVMVWPTPAAAPALAQRPVESVPVGDEGAVAEDEAVAVPLREEAPEVDVAPAPSARPAPARAAPAGGRRVVTRSAATSTAESPEPVAPEVSTAGGEPSRGRASSAPRARAKTTPRGEPMLAVPGGR